VHLGDRDRRSAARSGDDQPQRHADRQRHADEGRRGQLLPHQARARQAGPRHNAKVRHVGAKTKFYVGTLPSSIKLHFGKRYRVVIRACDKTGCSRTVRDKTLPKPSL
jgi:hypothetical protein